MTAALTLRAPTRDDHDELIDLLAKTFSHSGYFSFRDYLTRGYIDESHYDWQASRIGLRDGKIVTHFGVWDYQMRIGSARVRTGGIGVVATHGDHRKQGFMDLTARASVEAMRELGYDFTILFGISNFYHRFGYTRAWSDSWYYVPLSDLPGDPPAFATEDLKAAPRDDLAALFNRHYARSTGTAVRPTFRAVYYPGKDWQGVAWRYPRSKLKEPPIAGYIYFNHVGNRLDCTEAVGEVEQILAVIAEEARKRHCSEVRFETLPAAGELARHLRFGSCRVETIYNRCGGAMIAALNLRGALEKMLPELSARLAASPLRDWRGSLLVETPGAAVTLRIARGGKMALAAAGKTPHVLRAGDEIAQFLIGTDTPEEIAEGFGARFTGDARTLAGALFPAQYPSLHTADRY